MSRSATAADFDFFYRLYMHPLCNPFLLYEWMDESAFEPIFQDLLAQKVLYVFEVDGTPTGMFKLIRLAHRTDHIAYLGGVAISPECMGKGYGHDMMLDILDVGQKMGILRMELSTATSNLAAQRLYEKHGFEKEGVLRRYSNMKSEGRFLDEVMMAYLY